MLLALFSYLLLRGTLPGHQMQWPWPWGGCTWNGEKGHTQAKIQEIYTLLTLWIVTQVDSKLTDKVERMKRMNNIPVVGVGGVFGVSTRSWTTCLLRPREFSTMHSYNPSSSFLTELIRSWWSKVSWKRPCDWTRTVGAPPTGSLLHV